MYDQFMGASDGAWRNDAAQLMHVMQVPVPDDECSLVLAGLRGGQTITAVVEPPGTQPSVSASGIPT
eukprot:5132075-Heterocapsa_arctica.AAC.1